MTAQPAPATASRSPRRIRAQVIAALAVAATLLTACSEGQRAQTAVITPVIDGVQGTVGSIDLRLVTVATPNGSYPAGGDARIELYIVNNGAPDTLISVSSSAAKSAALFTSAATEFTVTPTTAAPTPSASSATSTSASASASTSGTGSSASGSGSASATPSATAAATTSAATAATSSAAAAPVAITLPAGETTAIGVQSSDPQILLSGLNSALYPAMSIPITFSFATAGTITLQVSVHLSTGAVDAPTLATSHETDDN